MDIQIIIGTDKESIARSLESCLVEGGYSVLPQCNSTQELLRKVTAQKIDLVILEPSMRGGALKALAHTLLQDYMIPVIILVNDAEAAHFYDMLHEVGFTCIQKPLGKQALLQSITLLITSMEAIRRLKSKVRTLEQQLEGLSRIEPAKQYLIKQKQMTEDEAHRYIQKESMNRKMSKEQIAKAILNQEI